MINPMESEKISIIVPIFNVEAFLERCLRSICGQSYKNLEVILVDDGSTDSCLDICERFAEKDSRIKVIHQNNQGVSSARNAGLEVATGDYIAFVDADDYIHQEMYERIYSLLKKYDADISACFSSGCWDSNYSEPPRTDIDISVYNKVGAIKTIFDPKYELNGIGVVVTNKLFKKKLFSNLRFSTQFRRGEDDQIIFYLMKRVDKYVITDERLYYYFNRPDSLVHKKTTEVQRNKELLSLVDMYEGRLSLLREEELKDPYKTCFLIMMNLTITAFFNIKERNEKITLVEKYRKHFGEFNEDIMTNLPMKDKIRYSTFKLYPQLYSLILIAAKRRPVKRT